MKNTKVWQCLALTLLVSLSFPQLRAQSAAAFDEQPVPVKAVPPVYPSELRQEGATGLVMIKLTIDENGDVTESAVTKSSRVEFERAALAVIGKWKFKPARKAGAAVRSQITLPIKFTAES